MIRVVDAETPHANMIEPKSFYKADPEWRNTLRNAIFSYPSVSFIDRDGKVLAIFGVSGIYAKVGELWGVTSDLAYKQPISFTRKAKEYLESYCRVHKMKRIQMVVPASQKDAYNFAVFLGFESEGRLKYYGPDGDDYFILGRIF